VLGATDRRVKAVVGQMPVVSGRGQVEATVRVDMINPTLALIAEDRLARFAGKPAGMLPITSADPAVPASLPMAEADEFFATLLRTRQISNWRNELTVRSMEYIYGYEPGLYLPKITPTPLLMIVGSDDRLAPTDRSLAAYETANAPKKLVILPGGHFTGYTGEGFLAASSTAREWFNAHLL
jgi:fermentation-respiration switch protein FrsA (DUF1100 family)